MSGMLGILVKEFIAVCEFLEKDPSRIYKGYLIIPKEELETLLNKNRYETADNKLKNWKTLKWIDAEEKRLTRRIYDSSRKRYVPYVKIDRALYHRMRELSVPV